MTTTINTQTYNKFYAENKRSIQNFIFKMTHNMETAEELVNDVFIKVYHNMHKFDQSKSSVKTWVYNIASNATIDYLRKRKIETTSLHSAYPDSDGKFHTLDLEYSDANPLDLLIHSESEKSIHDGIKNLSAQQGEILTKLALGYAYEEIAKDLGIPLGTVKGAIHLARIKMKEYFNKPVLA